MDDDIHVIGCWVLPKFEQGLMFACHEQFSRAEEICLQGEKGKAVVLVVLSLLLCWPTVGRGSCPGMTLLDSMGEDGVSAREPGKRATEQSSRIGFSSEKPNDVKIVDFAPFQL